MATINESSFDINEVVRRQLIEVDPTIPVEELIAKAKISLPAVFEDWKLVSVEVPAGLYKIFVSKEQNEDWRGATLLEGVSILASNPDFLKNGEKVDLLGTTRNGENLFIGRDGKELSLGLRVRLDANQAKPLFVRVEE